MSSRRKTWMTAAVLLVAALASAAYFLRPGSVERRVGALMDELPGVKQSPQGLVEVVLDKLGLWTPESRPLEETLDGLIHLGPPAARPLVTYLESGVDIEKRAAAFALGHIGSADAIEPLWAAFEAAGTRYGTEPGMILPFGDGQTVDVPLVRHYPKTEIAVALCRLRDGQGLAWLMELCGPWRSVFASQPGGEGHILPRDLVDEELLRSLVRAMGSSATPALTAQLHGDSRRPRVFAAELLVLTGDDGAIAPLTAALKDDDPEVAEAAARSLRKMR